MGEEKFQKILILTFHVIVKNTLFIALLTHFFHALNELYPEKKNLLGIQIRE